MFLSKRQSAFSARLGSVARPCIGESCYSLEGSSKWGLVKVFF